jgi:hypothetical protein
MTGPQWLLVLLVAAELTRAPALLVWTFRLIVVAAVAVLACRARDRGHRP